MTGVKMDNKQNIRLKIAKNIRAVRLDKGIKQVEVASYLKIDKSNYSKYELGKLEFSAEMIYKLAIYFQISADELLGLSD